MPSYPPDASISLTHYKSSFSPHHHKKHLGCERQIPQFQPRNVESDRDWDSVEERLERIGAHRRALEEDPSAFKSEFSDLRSRWSVVFWGAASACLPPANTLTLLFFLFVCCPATNTISTISTPSSPLISSFSSHLSLSVSPPTTGKKSADSFKSYVEEAKTMADLLGSTRQIRDPYDRGEHIPYSYSRIEPQEDNRPMSYDFDDSWFAERTRGYSPGNVRSLSPPPGSAKKWIQTMPALGLGSVGCGSVGGMSLSLMSDGGSLEDGLGYTKQEKRETRYSTIQLGKEWSKFRTARFKRNVAIKESRERQQAHEADMAKERTTTLDSITLFERRLRAMKEPGAGGGKKKKKDDSDSDADL
jgi:hypothetical protein